MANIYDHNGGSGLLTLDGLVDGNYVLGWGSDSVVSTLVFHVVVVSGTISITPKVRSIQANARRDVEDIDFQAVPYTQRNVNSTVSDDSSATAAITATGIFKMDITGLQPSLEIDQTDGTGFVFWSVIEGGAA